MRVDHVWLEAIVERALEEDLGAGDLTGETFIDEGRDLRVVLVSRQHCVLAGAAAMELAFQLVDKRIVVRRDAEDGVVLLPDQVVAQVHGPARGVLAAERTALNFVQQLSGVATRTRLFVEATSGTGVKIMDTRKTVPGLRILQKSAVVAGGGVNHRMGLFDAVMLKDNHLPLAGGLGRIQERIRSLRKKQPGVSVEIEADTVAQVRRLLELEGVDAILLDNMTTQELVDCVELRGASRVELEASGGVTLENVRAIAETGVDAISIGGLTHSAPAVDMGLDYAA